MSGCQDSRLVGERGPILAGRDKISTDMEGHHLSPDKRVEDDQRGDGDATDDPGLQEGAHQVHHHHLSQARSSVGGQVTVAAPLFGAIT